MRHKSEGAVTTTLTARGAKALTEMRTWQQAACIIYSRLEKRSWQDEQGRRYTCGGMNELKYVLLYYFESIPHAVKVSILRIPLEIAIHYLSGLLRRESMRFATQQSHRSHLTMTER